MTSSTAESFVYVIFIRTTPEQLWSALRSPQFTKQYWFGMHSETDWKVGSPWQLVFPDGRVADTGEVLEAVSAGWPRILSNLKSLLETGEVALK